MDNADHQAQAQDINIPIDEIKEIHNITFNCTGCPDFNMLKKTLDYLIANPDLTDSQKLLEIQCFLEGITRQQANNSKKK